MNLTKREDGVVLLAGEPVHEWFAKRGINPCQMAYARNEPNKKMCLAAAMGYAAVEGVMSTTEYEAAIYKSLITLDAIAEISGLDPEVLENVEWGYMGMPRTTNGQMGQDDRLGLDARRQLVSHFGKFFS